VKLSENQEIVGDLKQILEDYDYLEYDDARPNRDKKFEGLSVRITSDAKRNVQVIVDICHRLEKTTGRTYFFSYGGSYTGTDNLDEVWSFFTLREKIKHGKQSA
jgi:hypothetical protein